MILETERLFLREMKQSDFDLLWPMGSHSKRN